MFSLETDQLNLRVSGGISFVSEEGDCSFLMVNDFKSRDRSLGHLRRRCRNSIGTASNREPVTSRFLFSAGELSTHELCHTKTGVAKFEHVDENGQGSPGQAKPLANIVRLRLTGLDDNEPLELSSAKGDIVIKPDDHCVEIWITNSCEGKCKSGKRLYSNLWYYQLFEWKDGRHPGDRKVPLPQVEGEGVVTPSTGLCPPARI